jgi:hypothetical protein
MFYRMLKRDVQILIEKLILELTLKPRDFLNIINLSFIQILLAQLLQSVHLFIFLHVSKHLMMGE